MKEVSIIGVGMHPFGRFDDKPYTQIGLEAAIAALKDANIEWRQVQAAFCSRMYLPATTGIRVLTQLGRTGIPIADVEAACASGGVALRQAFTAIVSGIYDVVLALGVEKMPRGFMDPAAIYDEWQILTGLSQNPMYWALRARRHMETYGTTEEQIAKVAVKNHKNSVHNPYAMYRKEFTLEEILSSTVVCDPLRLLAMCAPNEGAAAAIVCPKDIAHKFNSKPVTVATCQHKVALYPHFSVPYFQLSAKITEPPVTTLTANAAYEAAGVGPKDLDVLELQDTEAFCEIEAYEELGLCQEGEGGRLIDEGVTEMGGKIPVNASGGLISKGEPVGASHLGQIAELVWQLRGEAGPRQIADAKVALAHVLGAGGNCAVTILKR